MGVVGEGQRERLLYLLRMLPAVRTLFYPKFRVSMLEQRQAHSRVTKSIKKKSARRDTPSSL